ncbi:class I SAM-dependent methyltransferase [Streptomyces sp. NPDC042319]|uniref:class I SAM-dependent methyltransferase n=1 Tax=Streptomyces sp. NPDC042319 TaxID=3154332 RepID=UPI0033F7FF5C
MADERHPSYDSTEATAAYLRTDRGTDWLLGHFFVFEALGLADLRTGTVLDFGCGPGAVARYAARHYGVQVLAADVAPAMLETTREHDVPEVEYHRITQGRVSDLPDACADVAMCSFVLTCAPSTEEIEGALAEIHRLLKPGGKLAVLGTDPACLGKAYTSVKPGKPGVEYRTGDTVPVRLRTVDGRWPTRPGPPSR